MIAMWRAMTDGLSVPVALHLDHCPDREVISLCLEHGWNSVLFDASKLTVEENREQCIEVVAEARRYGARRRGRDRGLQADRGATATRRAAVQALATVVDFVTCDRRRRVRPGHRQRPRHVPATPKLDSQRVTDIVEATGIPVALHGGTGMGPDAVHAT